MSYNNPETPDCCSSASAELKLYQAFIFSIPIIFTFVLLFLFYFFYIRRGSVYWSSIRMRTFNGITEEPITRPSELGLKKEIREMLPIIVFKESFSVKDTQCSVCLGDYQAEDKLQQIPVCGHTFHMDCIDHWLATHTTCPLCRFSLLPSSKTAPDHSDNRVEAQADEEQSYQESSSISHEVGTSVQTGAERESIGEESGSYCIRTKEECSDARREVEGIGCGGEVSDVVLDVETHGSNDHVLVTEHP
ncbi:RING-H2 finger protein ATL7-like [Macadamia integrifolia]|uniref:RING-H2 finger protein ATL7-like n=1 Tax=Macadamia integrifolia TaxID=60698 RepID=UPI001C500C03|nr:RING-H2 finger protein ATL7-like [Macadamia integrifolia]